MFVIRTFMIWHLLLVSIGTFSTFNRRAEFSPQKKTKEWLVPLQYVSSIKWGRFYPNNDLISVSVKTLNKNTFKKLILY